MIPILSACLLLAILVGHLTIWVYLFNRINATAFPRPTIKRIEKGIIACVILIPFILMWIQGDELRRFVLESNPFASPLVTSISATSLYSGLSLISLLLQAPRWLAARPNLLRQPREIHAIRKRSIDMRAELNGDVFATPLIRLLGGLPGNCLHRVDVNLDEAYLRQVPTAFDGLRLGHVSDLHLTGYMQPNFYQVAIEAMMNMAPDIVFFSGDLIDKDEYFALIPKLLKPIQPPLGSYFVLGNHDRRVSNVRRLRQTLVDLGWYDLGNKSKAFDVRGDKLYLIGNERPWFDEASRVDNEIATADERRIASFRIGLAHTPDQFDWGVKQKLDLLLCGHTHGGQARLPFIGPIIAPSWHGSRYASGWFRKSSTWMQVSRGLSGTQPFRFRCNPEVKVIVLKQNDTEDFNFD